jgi:hypothetical protein
LLNATLLFLLKILDIDDLELIPWNIVLLFSRAMSSGLRSALLGDPAAAGHDDYASQDVVFGVLLERNIL